MKSAPKNGSKILIAFDFRDGLNEERGMTIMWWDPNSNPKFPWNTRDNGGRIREDLLIGWRLLPDLPGE